MAHSPIDSSVHVDGPSLTDADAGTIPEDLYSGRSFEVRYPVYDVYGRLERSVTIPYRMLCGELLALEWLQARLGVALPALTVEDRDRLTHLTVLDCCLVGPRMPGYPPDKASLEKSYYCHPQIIIGVFKRDERRLASFFHEVGHSFPDRVDYGQPEGTWKVQSERHAWEDGFAMAKRLGVEFRPEVHVWANACVGSYRKGSRRR